MSMTVIVGGQYGSEGKGKVCAHLALRGDADIMVRCGGPNSGHTVDLGIRKFELKQVPCGFVNGSTRLLIASGALIDSEILFHEIEECGLAPGRLGIDRNTGILTGTDRQAEIDQDLRSRVGSTGMGVGSAVSRRVLRSPEFKLANDIAELQPFLTSVPDEVDSALSLGRKIVVEGTQGFGLSLYHTERWPYCTSRDTTAHSFLGEVGVGARDLNVIMAIRTYPIRVAGNSGPLLGEISWDELRSSSGYPHPITELTTTTKRVRRVARFDWDVVTRAARANRPSGIALHGADYISYSNRGVTDFRRLTPEVRRFVDALEERLEVPVILIGTGPHQDEIVDRRTASKVMDAGLATRRVPA
jgi:adenylosuccinate synthase